VSFVGSTPIAKYIYETAARGRQARAGARRREEPRGGAARCRPRVRRRRADRRGRTARRASAAWRFPRSSRSGAAGDPLVKLLEKKATAIKVGPGTEKDVEMGPLVTCQHRDKVASYIEQG
jgi:malonate-semialdehyde dehydrogenase (acetylating)/methylmalonate-semialdehyde dehydrogenase